MHTNTYCAFRLKRPPFGLNRYLFSTVIYNYLFILFPSGNVTSHDAEEPIRARVRKCVL